RVCHFFEYCFPTVFSITDPLFSIVNNITVNNFGSDFTGWISLSPLWRFFVMLSFNDFFIPHRGS
ncbi:hypothetical protein ABRP57_00010, partial [Pectobacterium aroidearum]|uniref:hypothetical protein n=1 Tax=Pectobacterium aroidearum TaxID=1201031 RepID=UPI0032EC94A9